VKVNNYKKGFSLIAVMMLVAIIGILVTLIIAATVTDTRKLLVETSNLRAYSLAENYLSQIVSNEDNKVFNDDQKLKDSLGNTCSIRTADKDFVCSELGNNKDSEVICSIESSKSTYSLKVPINDSLKLGLKGAEPTNTNPFITKIAFSNADGVMIILKYIDRSGVLMNYNFTVFKDNISYILGSSKVEGNRFASIIDPLSGTGSSVVLSSVTEGSNTFLDIANTSTGAFEINLYNLLKKSHINSTTLESLQIIPMKNTPGNALLSVELDKYLPAYESQFNLYKCKGNDGGEGNTSGLSSVELNVSIPKEKSPLPLLDYSLYLTAPTNKEVYLSK
jgi:type II secretory pathway pseudopilin PulG